MHIFWISLFGALAAAWIIQATRVGFGMLGVPWLADSLPASDEAAPSISIIFAARDEAQTLPESLPTLLNQDYPLLEVIAVNDRSSDATPTILRELASTSNRLKVVDIAELPDGWLGKPHALARGAGQATGEWLLFTDADVNFAPDALRRAVTLAQAHGWNHLTLLTGFDMRGFWEITVLTFFTIGFLLGNEPWLASHPKSSRYAGIGAFQMVRRSTYDAIGGHRRLAMEVVEDMKLGKLIKLGGFPSGLGIAPDFVWLRWYPGARHIIRGLTKNMFAAVGFSLPYVLLAVTLTFVGDVLPFLGVLFATGWVRWLAGISVAVVLAFHAGVAWKSKVSVLYALTHPLGGAIFLYIIARSTIVTLAQGGIIWRGTFYRLEDLRRGSV